MRKRPELVLLLCLGAAVCGCADTPLGHPAIECSGAVSCSTADCYSACVCARADAQACQAQCPSRGVRVEDLDESSWSDDWAGWEDEVLDLTNAARDKGGCCGDEGCFAATPPLTLEPTLRRSARSHALDMATRNYFAHDSPEGISPFDRMRQARFKGCALGENIAAGQTSPGEVVRGWLASPGHCANMLSPNFDRIGVGYHPSEQRDLRHVWVQNFGQL